MPVDSVSGGLYHFLRFPPLSGAHIRSLMHCEVIPHGQSLRSGDSRGLKGDLGCVRSDWTNWFRVDQQPAISAPSLQITITGCRIAACGVSASKEFELSTPVLDKRVDGYSKIGRYLI